MKIRIKFSIITLCILSAILSGFSQIQEINSRKDTQTAIPDQSHQSSVSKYSPAFYNVKQFGAKGDSTTLETDAINKAIDNVRLDTNRDGFEA